MTIAPLYMPMPQVKRSSPLESGGSSMRTVSPSGRSREMPSEGKMILLPQLMFHKRKHLLQINQRGLNLLHFQYQQNYRKNFLLLTH